MHLCLVGRPKRGQAPQLIPSVAHSNRFHEALLLVAVLSGMLNERGFHRPNLPLFFSLQFKPLVRNSSVCFQGQCAGHSFFFSR